MTGTVRFGNPQKRRRKGLVFNRRNRNRSSVNATLAAFLRLHLPDVISGLPGAVHFSMRIFHRSESGRCVSTPAKDRKFCYESAAIIAA
jgi:hypothetical protein